MADQSLKKRFEGCAFRIFLLGIMTWSLIMALARNIAGTHGVEQLTTTFPLPVLIVLGALQTWLYALNRNRMVAMYMAARELARKNMFPEVPNITAWTSLSRTEMEEIVQSLAEKIRQGNLQALNISILPGKDDTLLLSGIINEGHGIQAIAKLTQQGTTDPSGALSSAHFKGDRE